MSEPTNYSDTARELCGPDFDASGLTDEELGALIDAEIAAHRRERLQSDLAKEQMMLAALDWELRIWPTYGVICARREGAERVERLKQRLQATR